jgi:hypothetical protein
MAKNSVTLTFLSIVLLVLTLAFTGCSNITNAVPPVPKTNSQPLDPQGNWLFVLTDSHQSTWSFGGELFELTSPTVTSNNMGAVSDPLNCNVSPILSGEASGTNSITLNLSGRVFSPSTPVPVYTLTGTIADDQQHMSGSFTSAQNSGCISTTSGTWTAMFIPAVNGTWNSTVNGGTITLSMTENTDQTSINMGQITGTLTIGAGNTCAAAGTYTFDAGSVHVGEVVQLLATDSNKVQLFMRLTVDPATNNSAVGDPATSNNGVGGLTYSGGTCAQSGFFALTFTKQ